MVLEIIFSIPSSWQGSPQPLIHLPAGKQPHSPALLLSRSSIASRAYDGKIRISDSQSSA